MIENCVLPVWWDDNFKWHESQRNKKDMHISTHVRETHSTGHGGGLKGAWSVYRPLLTYRKRLYILSYIKLACFSYTTNFQCHFIMDIPICYWIAPIYTNHCLLKLLRKVKLQVFSEKKTHWPWCFLLRLLLSFRNLELRWRAAFPSDSRVSGD